MPDRLPREYHLQFERAWKAKVRFIKLSFNPETEKDMYEWIQGLGEVPAKYIKRLIAEDMTKSKKK